uniref:Sushi domain-containing protein n=1 Tax=Podarcis muralis TaxID=64176 RepID=A0A670IA61_PODMU
MIDPVHKQHTCDPSLTVGSPHDTQPLLVDLVFLEGPWVLRVVHQQGLDLQVAACVGTEEQGQTVLHGLVARQLGLLLCDESPFGHPLPKQPGLVTVEDLLWNVALRLHNLQELRCKVFSCRNIRTGSLSMPEKKHTSFQILANPSPTCPNVPCNRFLFLFQCIITDAAGKCGPPPPVKNGDFLGLATSEYMPGARVRYKCQALYNMQGDEYVRCVNGHWTDTPTCIAPCTATEEDMNQNNIQLKWKYANKIYSASGDVTEFDCKRGFQKDPSSPPFRAQCREGKLDYPRCIPVGTLQLKHNYRKFNTHSCDFC